MDIHYSVQLFQGKNIVSFKFYNGYRFEHFYVKSFYRGKYEFTLDYTYAKTYSLNTAIKHMNDIRNSGIAHEIVNRWM